MTVKVNDQKLKELGKAIESLTRLIATNDSKIVDKGLIYAYNILIDMYQESIAQQIEEN